MKLLALLLAFSSAAPLFAAGEKIAVIPKGTTHSFWKSVEAGARQAGKDLNVEVIWKGALKEDDRAGQIALVQQFVSSGVVLQVNQAARLDVQLTVGAISEQVSVTREASVLETESASSGSRCLRPKRQPQARRGGSRGQIAGVAPPKERPYTMRGSRRTWRECPAHLASLFLP